MEKYEYKVAKLKAGGFIATYQGSPVSGSYSEDQNKVTDWIEANDKEQKVSEIESRAFNKLGNLPAGTDKDSIAFISNDDDAEWLNRLDPFLAPDILALLGKIKERTPNHGYAQEIVMANMLINMYNRGAITTDKGKIVYSKKD